MVVVALNGRRFAGAMRDTVQVPPMAMATVAVDAGEVARWMLHCHHMPHLSTGMMTELAVAARAALPLQIGPDRQQPDDP